MRNRALRLQSGRHEPTQGRWFPARRCEGRRLYADPLRSDRSEHRLPVPARALETQRQSQGRWRGQWWAASTARVGANPRCAAARSAARRPAPRGSAGRSSAAGVARNGPGGPSSRHPTGRTSVAKHHGPCAIHQDTALQQPPKRARQHPTLDVTTNANQVIRRMRMADAFHVLFDDWALVEVGCYKVRRRADDLYTALMSLMVGLRAFEPGQERVVYVDAAAAQL